MVAPDKDQNDQSGKNHEDHSDAHCCLLAAARLLSNQPRRCRHGVLHGLGNEETVRGRVRFSSTRAPARRAGSARRVDTRYPGTPYCAGPALVRQRR